MNAHKPTRFFPFLVGLILGILSAVFLPAYVRPYIPEWITGKMIAVKGTVSAKQKKADVLLLTVETPEGVLLATFNRKVDEINLLINEKDTIEFTLPKYLPFIDDPKIVRVAKEPLATPAPVPPPKPSDQSVREARPKPHEKIPASAPVSGIVGTRSQGRK